MFRDTMEEEPSLAILPCVGLCIDCEVARLVPLSRSECVAKADRSTRLARASVPDRFKPDISGVCPAVASFARALLALSRLRKRFIVTGVQSLVK